MLSAEITADQATRALLVGIVDMLRASFQKPYAIASSSHLQSGGVPVGTVYGIAVVIDEAVPEGAIEIRSRAGSRRIERFYTRMEQAA